MIPLLAGIPRNKQEILTRNLTVTPPSPMLAKTAEAPFSAPGWLFERKLDGERTIARVAHGEVEFLTRNGSDLAPTFPELVDHLKRLSGDATRRHGSSMAGPVPWMADGEIVAMDDGVSSLPHLQERFEASIPPTEHSPAHRIAYHIFDLIHLDGWDLTGLALTTRKRLLQEFLPDSDPIHLVDHMVEEGKALFETAREKGWEGIVGKRMDSAYVPGRSGHWRKLRCIGRHDLVIGGYTQPQGRRIGFGAVLVGYYDEDGHLRYAGKVGSGFTVRTLESLSKALRRLHRKTSPFRPAGAGDVPRNGVQWVSPRLVADFAFSEWPPAGKLRHPRYRGLRRGKPAREVIREEPVEHQGTPRVSKPVARNRPPGPAPDPSDHAIE